ncbi:DUF4386 domain-containing protein [Actinomycetospora sp. TBRC 11914]|uniref:DUF4386 domain-containing protein n=1 Tax=Actinomycetospora sp. TBRC 11914 TaxID=2729387 RepID=UPI00145D9A33|nr:DUF4386 domain-containing protein [Actinomycetospora sp. TBRC 11914]NMO89092.1 DUF4386 domain-containing protein [Actinomycetospora sp. TBRC 11914]
MADPGTHARRGGPPLLAPGLAWAALTLATPVLWTGGRPGAGPATTLALVRDHAATAELAASLLLASAVPFAVWVATVHHRLHRLGLRVAGPTLGRAGGLLAAALLALSGVAGWAAAATAALVPGAEATGAVVALEELSFAAGGPGFVVAFGLLIAGVAVPTLLGRLLPRPLAVVGLALAGIAALAVLSLVLAPLQYLLPVVRFGGLVWLVWVSAVLPTSRRRVETTREAEPVR